MANKEMKSFRMSSDAVMDMSIISQSLGITNTEAVELALRFFVDSGAEWACSGYAKNDGRRSYAVMLHSILDDGYITCALRDKALDALGM